MEKAIIKIQKIAVVLLILSTISFFIYHLWFITPFYRAYLYGDQKLEQQAQVISRMMFEPALFGVLIAIFFIPLGVTKKKSGLFTMLFTIIATIGLSIFLVQIFIQLIDFQEVLQAYIVPAELTEAGFSNSPVTVIIGQALIIGIVILLVVLSIYAIIGFIKMVSNFKREIQLNEEKNI